MVVGPAEVLAAAVPRPTLARRPCPLETALPVVTVRLILQVPTTILVAASVPGPPETLGRATVAVAVPTPVRAVGLARPCLVVAPFLEVMVVANTAAIPAIPAPRLPILGAVKRAVPALNAEPANASRRPAIPYVALAMGRDGPAAVRPSTVSPSVAPRLTAVHAVPMRALQVAVLRQEFPSPASFPLALQAPPIPTKPMARPPTQASGGSTVPLATMGGTVVATERPANVGQRAVTPLTLATVRPS